MGQTPDIEPNVDLSRLTTDEKQMIRTVYTALRSAAEITDGEARNLAKNIAALVLMGICSEEQLTALAPYIR